MVWRALVAGFCVLAVTFTITATNHGPDDATGVVANDASATLLLRVRVNLTTKVTNTAATAAGTPADFDPANNIARTSVTGSTVPGLPNNGVPESTSSGSAGPRGWGGVIAAGSLLVVVVIAVITAAKRRKI